MRKQSIVHVIGIATLKGSTANVRNGWHVPSPGLKEQQMVGPTSIALGVAGGGCSAAIVIRSIESPAVWADLYIVADLGAETLIAVLDTSEMPLPLVAVLDTGSGSDFGVGHVVADCERKNK